MKLRHVYLSLCIVGVLLPYSHFLPWLQAHGLDLPLFFTEIFESRVGAFFALDVLVSVVVLFLFVGVEGRRIAADHLWAPLVATVACGVSAGFPLFLYLRQRKLDADFEAPALRG